MLDALPVAVLAVTRDGDIVFANQVARSLLGVGARLDRIVGALASAAESHPLSSGSLQSIVDGDLVAREAPCALLVNGAALAVEVSASRWNPNGQPLALVCVRDASERRAVEARLLHASTHDALTGCFNRALLEERRDSLDANERSYAAVIADVDGLKVVNDRLGHEAGDALIVAAAEAMTAAARDGDIVARLGGDEFVLIIVGGDHEAVARAIARIRECCERSTVEARGARLSLSVGGAVRRSDEPLAAVMKRADQRMYADKSERRRATSASRT